MSDSGPVPPSSKNKPTRAVPSEAVKAQRRADALDSARCLNEDINSALDEIDEIVARLSSKHEKSEEQILELIHLGGHVLKQKRRPGINNAYWFCVARCEKEWAEDPTKEEVRTVIEAAKELHDYHGLSFDEKKVLIDALQASRDENDTGIVRKPMAQAQDTRITMERVCRELKNLHCRSGQEIILLSVKSSLKYRSQPTMFITDAAKAFLSAILKLEITTVMGQFEAFAINGIQGVFQKHENQKNYMKGNIRETLRRQIESLAGITIKRLEFKNFTKLITIPHGIVLDGWIGAFETPSSFKSTQRLVDMNQAVEQGKCKARKLSEAEWKEVKDEFDRSKTNEASTFGVEPDVENSESAARLGKRKRPNKDTSTGTPSTPHPESIPTGTSPTIPSNALHNTLDGGLNGNVSSHRAFGQDAANGGGEIMTTTATEDGLSLPNPMDPFFASMSALNAASTDADLPYPYTMFPGLHLPHPASGNEFLPFPLPGTIEGSADLSSFNFSSELWPLTGQYNDTMSSGMDNSASFTAN